MSEILSVELNRWTKETVMVYILCLLAQALIVRINLEIIAGKIVFGMEGFHGSGSR